MIRRRATGAGGRGAGKWKAVSWAEAVSFIARKMLAIKAEDGAEAVAFARGVSMNNNQIVTRLANLFGTPNIASINYYCYGPRTAACTLMATGRFAARGWRADGVTAARLAFGLGAALCIALKRDAAALLFFLLGRLCDGLDGALARATARTDRGGFIDIVGDFVVYGAVPLAFAVREPQANAIPAAVLLFAFYVNGATFLAFAAIAAKRRLESLSRGVKSIYFTAGLAEGTETILVFAAMMLWPAGFPLLAYGFAGLTLMSALARTVLAWRLFAEEEEETHQPG
ncbi:MAG: molybdopterin-dependent oxidoreductase, partial [Phycisphaerales bacterium]|nr:molybdopterin-dependent oxidoreductase [Phycisphaerales bacterium]